MPRALVIRFGFYFFFTLYSTLRYNPTVAMSVEISEGRVTNYVLSTLSAVLVVVVVVQYE